MPKSFFIYIGISIGVIATAGVLRLTGNELVLGAVPSNSGFIGIYNATTTDLSLRDGYGSALATDQHGRLVTSSGE